MRSRISLNLSTDAERYMPDPQHFTDDQAISCVWRVCTFLNGPYGCGLGLRACRQQMKLH